MFHEDDLDGDVGSPDVRVLKQVSEAFLKLDGIGDAEWARFDVRWYRSGCYSFHHIDSEGVNFRWDCHPKDGAPRRHFHPVPDAPSNDAEESCIEEREPKVVARAVHKLWRRAYEEGSLKHLNTAENPP